MADRKPLGIKAYGHIPHLPGSRMGAGDHHCHEGQSLICTEKARDKHDRIIVQEKLDGTCVSVALLDGVLTPLIRAGYPAVSAPRYMHRLFASWCFSEEERLRSVIPEGHRLCGEWLVVAHSTKYALPHAPFVAFDMMVGQARVLGAEELARVCANAGVTTPKILHAGDPLSIERAMELVGNSHHGALEPVEGCVWRVERKGHTDFLTKYVRHDKVDGVYLPRSDDRGISAKKGDHVWNTWQDWKIPLDDDVERLLPL